MAKSRVSHGIVLFGHGARKARWAEPFQRLAAMLQRARGEEPVTLAFLELMAPSLPEAVAQLAASGCARITVVPVFFGAGEHLQRDLPKLAEACRAAHPKIQICSTPPVGEDNAILDAIVQFCLTSVA